MTHSFIKKALTFIGVAALAVPLALGMNGQKVSAVDTPDTQTQKVILTKYGFSSQADLDAATKDQNTDVTPDEFSKGLNAQPINGAEYSVYDVSNQYYDNLSSFEADDPKAEGAKTFDAKANEYFADFKTDGLTTVGDPKKTGNGDEADGQATFELPTTVQSGTYVGEPAVYLFVESQTPTGYKSSANFIVSMNDAKAKKDDAIHVYPKEPISETYQLKFQKTDKNTKKALNGVTFEITRGKLFAEVAGFEQHAKFDNKQIDTPLKVTWTSDESQATYFVSGTVGDIDGIFGFSSNPELTNKAGVITGLNPDEEYGITEITPATGYNNDAELPDGVSSVKPSKDTVVVTDTPQGILPHTGGAGIVMYIVIGVALVVLGTVAYKKRRAS